MLNKKFGAFTLAEIMIVFTVIGILTAILLPSLFQSSPDKEKLKVKKAFNTISRAVDNLANSDAYELTGGILDSTSYISDVDVDGDEIDNVALARNSYFCTNLADMLNVKNVNCSLNFVNDELDGLEGLKCTEEADTPSNSSTPVCIYNPANNETEIESTDIDYEDFQNNLDIACQNYQDTGKNRDPENHYNIITSDGVAWGIQLTNFSQSQTVLVNGVTTPLSYGVICFNVDGGKSPEHTYGLAIRRDGKLQLGMRLQEILDEDYTNVFNE